jgi:poly-beta-1,6-N-acetyl-D-glucosamine synthase
MDFGMDQLNLIGWLGDVPVWIFGISTLLQCFVWFFIYGKMAKAIINDYSKGSTPFSEEGKPYPPVSIIICARDEEENLSKNLPFFIDQDYPKFEIVVVNDGSVDSTYGTVTKLARECPYLCIVQFPQEMKTSPGKKLPLAFGIRQAQHEWLLLTDADCVPASKHWIRTMMDKASIEKPIVLGVSPFNVVQWDWLQRFQVYELVNTFLSYGGFALKGLPYMGVGRNLLYHRSKFDTVNGFDDHIKIASGDDDLFVSAVSNTHNTTICTSFEGFTKSDTKATWREYIHQKKRHLSAGLMYKPKHLVLLGLISMVFILHYLGGLILLMQGKNMEFAIGYLIRMTLIILVLRPLIRKMGYSQLIFFVPFLDIMFALYQMMVPFLTIDKTYRWK